MIPLLKKRVHPPRFCNTNWIPAISGSNGPSWSAGIGDPTAIAMFEARTWKPDGALAEWGTLVELRENCGLLSYIHIAWNWLCAWVAFLQRGSIISRIRALPSITICRLSGVLWVPGSKCISGTVSHVGPWRFSDTSAGETDAHRPQGEIIMSALERRRINWSRQAKDSVQHK